MPSVRQTIEAAKAKVQNALKGDETKIKELQAQLEKIRKDIAWRQMSKAEGEQDLKAGAKQGFERQTIELISEHNQEISKMYKEAEAVLGKLERHIGSEAVKAKREELNLSGNNAALAVKKPSSGIRH